MFMLRISKWIFFLLIIICTLITSSGGIRFGYIAGAFSRTAIRNPFPKFTFNMPKFSPEEIPLSRIPESRFSGAILPAPPRSFLEGAVPKYSGPNVYHQLPPLNFDSLDTIPKSSGLGVDRSPILPESTQPKQSPSFVDELPNFAQDKRPKSLAQEEDEHSAFSEAKEFDKKSNTKESAPEEKSDFEIPHIHTHEHSSESETKTESPQPNLPDQDENPKEKRDKDDSLRCDFLKLVRNKKIVWKCRHSFEGITTCRVKCRRPFQLATQNGSVYVCTRVGGWMPKAIPKCFLPEAV